jgi:hypothetical protein
MLKFIILIYCKKSKNQFLAKWHFWGSVRGFPPGDFFQTPPKMALSGPPLNSKKTRFYRDIEKSAKFDENPLFRGQFYRGKTTIFGISQQKPLKVSKTRHFCTFSPKFHTSRHPIPICRLNGQK